jgi:hypothetical protein
LIPIVERNVLPPLTVNGAFQMEIAYALLLAIVGFALVLLIERAANHADSNDRTV